MDKYELAERIGKTEYLVEADLFAVQCLFERHSEGIAFSWEGGSGIGLQVGTLDDRPVMLSLSWYAIGGALVCFWSSESEVVDHRMIKAFLAENFKGVPTTDAQNFHHVLRFVADREGPPAKVASAELFLGREAVEDFRDTGVLTTRAFETSAVAKGRGEWGADLVHVAVSRVNEACDRFRQKVWVPWLKSYYREAQERGHSAQSGNLAMLMYGIAGRVVVSMRERAPSKGAEGWHVSLLGYDGEGQDGLFVRGARGNADALVEMLDEACRLSESLESDIRPDASVGMGF